ncbi:MAG: TPM domain-containing protein [Bacteroidales bacterium]|nr:TPM domain-containing protein [Bacteroidales bacterium]
MGKSVRYFFSETQKEDIRLAIKNAELDASGEIRVHVENSCEGDVMDRTALLFEKLGMTRTKLRNGVLFYLAVDNRKFAVIGDKGINARVGDDFWEEIKMKMLYHFREGNFAQGLIEGIEMVGPKLRQFFPYQKDDVNELSDEISFGEK